MSLAKRLVKPSLTLCCRWCAAVSPKISVLTIALPVTDHYSYASFKQFSTSAAINSPSAAAAAEEEEAPIAQPELDNVTHKVYSDKVTSLVENIANLTLLEVADLNELLKIRLGLPDVSMAAPVVSNSATFQSGSEENQDEAQGEQSSGEKLVFNVKLVKFEVDSKVKLIKEVKSVIEGMNLVQAKKFVEGVPQMVMSDIPKEEAEKIKEKLEAAGGTVEVE